MDYGAAASGDKHNRIEPRRSKCERRKTWKLLIQKERNN